MKGKLHHALILAIFLIARTFAIGAPAPAPEAPVQIHYYDADGFQWKRLVIQEAHEGHTLLLVVDRPELPPRNNTPAETVIHRKNYGANEIAELNRDNDFYSNLNDNPETKKRAAVSELQSRILHKPLWIPIKEEWSIEDENAYADWFRRNVTTNYLIGSGIAVDCADFALAVRWIYAHDHALPIANSLSGGELFGHWSGSSAWDNLPTDPEWRKDRRFLAALRMLLGSAYTHTIIEDLYPVRLSQEFLTPGSIILTLYSQASGHTQVLNHIGEDESICNEPNCISVLYGNEPARETTFLGNAWIQNRRPEKGGFLRWRWPIFANDKWQLASKSSMPGYSLEQYSVPGYSDEQFNAFVFEKLGIEATLQSQAAVLANEITLKLDFRARIVSEGYYYCAFMKCNLGDELYESYSTPNRDRQLRDSIGQFHALLSQIPVDDPKITQLLQSLLRSSPTGIAISYYDYFFNTNGVLDQMSPDPTQGLLERWGITPPSMETKLFLAANAWAMAWHARSGLVAQAQELCYADEKKDLTCNPNAPEVRALDTNRFDAGIKLGATELKNLYDQSAGEIKNEIADILYNAYVNAPEKCYWNDDSNCNDYDFVLGGHPMLERMRSESTATFEQRFGF